MRSRSIKPGDYRGRCATILDVTEAPRRLELPAAGLSREGARTVVEALKAGGLVIYPTDTLYAVGCDARNPEALARLRAAKGREAGKAFPVIAADEDDARRLASHWPEAAARLAAAFWPGPLTLVVPAAADLPAELLAGAAGVAVRVPASSIARALAAGVGPLVSTSANLAGEPPCTTVELALAAFPSADLAIDIGPLDGAPSTIVDLTGDAPRVIREGRVIRAHIETVLADAVHQGRPESGPAHGGV